MYIFNQDKVISFVQSLIVSYPSSKSLSYFWNGGSMLGFVLMFQILSGFILVFFYVPFVIEASHSVDYISREVWSGVLIRSVHLGGATLFSFLLLFHISRGLFSGSFVLAKVWWSGSSILIMQMAIAFLGYVLVWGQMSLWGATVITNLISAIPFIGQSLVFWFWGGFNLNTATLSFFFALHYILPMLLLVLVFFHLILLHETSSSSPLQIHESFTKIKFNPYYSMKDILNLLLIFIFFGLVCFSPWVFGDPENWAVANPMSSPVHIQPEWYFLFAYEILRSIPNKLGGVLALAGSVMFFFLMPLMPSMIVQNLQLQKVSLSFFIHIYLILTWLGSCPVSEPFISIGTVYTFLYFSVLFFFIFGL